MARQKWTTDEKEFNVVVYTLKMCKHDLVGKEFILYLDHDALKYLIS